MSAPEFSRTVALDTVGPSARDLAIEADGGERAALARRFDLIALDRLVASFRLWRDGDDVRAEGRIEADVVQGCVATGEPVPAAIDAPFALIFRHSDPGRPDEEIELGESEMDVVFFDGGAIDIGEAAAETLALSLDPYPRAPGADDALKAAGVKSEEEAGPFGVLAGLKDRLSGPDRET
jgi:uncharacterized metal-binding protein YceD (DUF177 family)